MSMEKNRTTTTLEEKIDKDQREKRGDDMSRLMGSVHPPGRRDPKRNPIAS